VRETPFTETAGENDDESRGRQTVNYLLLLLWHSTFLLLLFPIPSNAWLIENVWQLTTRNNT